MRRFQVPQFIEVEDKLFGPLTLKQFIYLLGGGAITFILWVSLPSILAIILAAPVIGFSLGLSFYKINGLPLITVLSHAIQYSMRSRLYLWKKERQRKHVKKEYTIHKSTGGFIIPKTTKGALRDLAWSLDVQKNIGEKRKIPKPLNLKLKQ